LTFVFSSDYNFRVQNVYHSRKYTLNENFFSVWTPEMAYGLGFWYADGDMRQAKSYRIRFSSRDQDHLEKIKHIFGSNSPLFRDIRNGVPKNAWYLILHSKKLYYDLKSLGGKRSKSTTLRFPYIKINYLPDFIRGYFDGDGSVHYISYKATKNGKIYTELRCNFTCGSKRFLEKISEILQNNLNLPMKVIGQYGPHQFKLGYGQKSTIKLLNFMYYQGHTISLKRKSKYVQRI